MRKLETGLPMNLRSQAKETGFFNVRFFRRAGRPGYTAGETPAVTPGTAGRELPALPSLVLSFPLTKSGDCHTVL